MCYDLYRFFFHLPLQNNTICSQPLLLHSLNCHLPLAFSDNTWLSLWVSKINSTRVLCVLLRSLWVCPPNFVMYRNC